MTISDATTPPPPRIQQPTLPPSLGSSRIIFVVQLTRCVSFTFWLQRGLAPRTSFLEGEARYLLRASRWRVIGGGGLCPTLQPPHPPFTSNHRFLTPHVVDVAGHQSLLLEQQWLIYILIVTEPLAPDMVAVILQWSLCLNRQVTQHEWFGPSQFIIRIGTAFLDYHFLFRHPHVSREFLAL